VLKSRDAGVIAVAAPAGAVEEAALERGLGVLRDICPEADIRVDDQARARRGYLAGPDQDRAAHLAELMHDPDVGAVLAARGGFGSSRLLPLLDFGRLAASGKLLVGFSDLTCLLNPLAAAGAVAVHGPVLTQLHRLDAASRQDLAGVLCGRPAGPRELTGRSLVPGRARGRLMGGNLTMLCHLLGTPWFPPLADCILFIEETNEPPYRLDRLLTQLELAGAFQAASGVAAGRLSGQGEDAAELTETLERRLAGLGRPVVVGLPFGHGAANRCLPMGAPAVLDGDAGLLLAGVNLA
jgi:muramoyltetrapeptide carboxypeptidase